MSKKLTELYVKGKVKLVKAMERFATEEKGVETWVAIVVVIVIVIVIAGVFQERITTAVGDLFDNLDEFIKKSK